MDRVVLSRSQVRRMDRIATERYRIPGLILMENAGRSAARVIDEFYGPQARVAIVCGPGNNGGDGCVIARHLHNSGWRVRLLFTGSRKSMTEDTQTNFAIVSAMPLQAVESADSAAAIEWISRTDGEEIMVDALLGTGFQGQVRNPVAQYIAAINAAPKRAVVAVDLPSGLDCDSGQPSNATVRADCTVTIVAMKPGLYAPQAVEFVGRAVTVDIGVPRELVHEAANWAIQDSNL